MGLAHLGPSTQKAHNSVQNEERVILFGRNFESCLVERAMIEINLSCLKIWA